MKILVIGESCRDIFHYGECSRLCPAAPVPVFKSVSIEKNGGMAKNVQENLNSLGVETDIVTNEGWTTITKTRYVDLNSNHMFLRVDENDDLYGKINLDISQKKDFEIYDAIVVSDYNKGFLSTHTLQKVSRLHSLVFLDTKKILGEWCNDFRFIKINNREYESTKRTLTKNLKEKLIITRGPYGSEHEGELFPVSSVEVKDTSGAGDTFLAALVKKYVETKDIKQSIVFANECATSVVQKRGVSAL